MFRWEEAHFGGWNDKTIEYMEKRRFEQSIARLPSLGEAGIEVLNCAAFEKRIEQCWQGFERKPLRSQQLDEIRQAVLKSIEIHADCLSRDEHDLVERALVLGGSVQIEDICEMDAADALSRRLWANVGLVSGRPFIELDSAFIRAIAQAFDREEHEQIRRRFDGFYLRMSAQLYRAGILDDRYPQKQILREVLHCDNEDERAGQLARQYLWASYNCIDYSDGVLLFHRAIAEPRHLLNDARRKTVQRLRDAKRCDAAVDILTEEIPLQNALEWEIEGVLRRGLVAHDVARTIRFLCKQGASLSAMAEVLGNSLIVHLSSAMKSALREMYYKTPKWLECSDLVIHQ